MTRTMIDRHPRRLSRTLTYGVCAAALTVFAAGCASETDVASSTTRSSQSYTPPYTQPATLIGPTGYTGPAGPTGPTGTMGAMGAPGYGLTGPTGATGVAGPMGPQGAIGPSGAPGEVIVGARGATGAVGPVGAQGATGQVGAQGYSVAGAAGLAGPSGPAGPRGLVGPTGVQGATLIGPVGATGGQGAAGAQGTSGQTGTQGYTMAGSAGATGSAGPAGVRGGIGSTGGQGPVGIVGQWTPFRVISFDSSRADLTASDARQVSEIAAYLRQNPSIHVGLDGYWDPNNQTLSNRRIGTVRDALVQAGTPAYRIETGAFGNPQTKREGQVEVLLISAR